MAVDQARHQNFFKDMIINNNNLYSNNSNITTSLGAVGALILPTTVNDSLLYPLHNLNDVVFQSLVGKFPPAVKDDSGVTFNNNLVSSTPLSRKRCRESPAIISGNAALPLIATTGSNFGKDCNDFTFLGEDFSFQIAQQQLEIDRLISQHMEKMRLEIEEKRRQQLRRIIGSIEEAIINKLRNKEEEINKISKINFSLEERLKSLLLENQIWRDLAQTNEATANALRTNLEQILQNADSNELADDAVSCCGSNGYGVEDEEDDVVGERWLKREKNSETDNKWIYRGKNEESKKRVCKKCGEGESRVLLLPCRHLCLCTLCGPKVNSCPLCNSVKNASVHVNFS